MGFTVISTPEKTIDGILSNVVASRAQAPFELLVTDFLDKDNFKIVLEIRDENDVPLIDTIYKYSPKPDGTLFIDLGKTISEIQLLFVSPSIQFKVWMSQIFDGQGGGIPAFTGGPYLGVYGSKQLLAKGGSNMYEYILGTETSKLLTQVKIDSIWTGLNRYASFLIDSNFQARTGFSSYQVVQTTYNSDFTQLGEVISTPLTDLTPGIKQYIVKPTTQFAQGIKIVSGATQISEEIFYKQELVCDNQILVEWINSQGAWVQHLFQINQLFETTAEKGVTSQIVINADIENVRRTKIRLVDAWIQKVIVQEDDLTTEQFKALEEINHSSGVRIWLNNDGSEWVGVVVAGLFSSEYSSKSTRHEISFMLEMPDNFDINKAINYPAVVYSTLIDSDGDTLIDLDGDTLIG